MKRHLSRLELFSSAPYKILLSIFHLEFSRSWSNQWSRGVCADAELAEQPPGRLSVRDEAAQFIRGHLALCARHTHRRIGRRKWSLRSLSQRCRRLCLAIPAFKESEPS